MSTDEGSKTAEASEMTHIENSAMPVATDSQCNVEPENSQAKNRNKKRQKGTQDAQSGHPKQDVSSIKNSSLQRDSCLESEVYISSKSDLKSGQTSEMTPINDASGQVITNSSQTEKKRQKRVQDDGKSDPPGEVSSLENSSLQKDSCSQSAVDVSAKVDSETAQASGMNTISTCPPLVVTDCTSSVESEVSETKNREKKTQTVKNRKEKIMQDVQADLPGDISSIKNSSIGGDSCCEPEADVCTKADLKTAQSSQIGSTQPHKRKQRCKAVTVDVCVSLEVASTSVLEENAFRAKQQSGIPGNASASLRRYDKELVPLEVSSTHLTGQNTLISEHQSGLPGNVSILIGQNTMISEEQSCSPRSGSSSLVKLSDSLSQHDIVSHENEIVQAFQKDDGSLKTSHRKRKSHDALGSSVQPIVKTYDGSGNLFHVPRVEVHISSIKDVQDNLDEKGSSLSNGKVGFEENGKMTVMKINVDSDGPTMEENTPQVPHFSPKGSHTRRSNRKLLILDINGLLADIVSPSHFGPKPDITISQKSVFKRPFCDNFLQFCLEKFDVGVWSSRTKKNVELAVSYLFGDLKDKLIFCWDQYHCTKTGFCTIENRDKPLVLKELKKLWEHLKSLPGNKGEYDDSNTLLLDDSPYKALSNPVHTCLFPRSYSHRDKKDSSIGPGGDLRVYLEQLAEAPDVAEFVARKPFGQRAITKSSPSWGFYQKILSSL